MGSDMGDDTRLRACDVRLSMARTLWFIPLALILGYAASPYVALWRLGQALRCHDQATLARSVDWTQVRSGLKVEIADAVDHGTVGGVEPAGGASATVKQASLRASADDLPGFGDSFASDAVSNAVDEDVNPANVGSMFGQNGPSHMSVLAEARSALGSAFFTGLQHFEVRLHTGRDPHDAPVRVRMAFSARHGWRVISVWLPQAMLGDQAHT